MSGIILIVHNTINTCRALSKWQIAVCYTSYLQSIIVCCSTWPAWCYWFSRWTLVLVGLVWFPTLLVIHEHKERVGAIPFSRATGADPLRTERGKRLCAPSGDNLPCGTSDVHLRLTIPSVASSPGYTLVGYTIDSMVQLHRHHIGSRPHTTQHSRQAVRTLVWCAVLDSMLKLSIARKGCLVLLLCSTLVTVLLVGILNFPGNFVTHFRSSPKGVCNININTINIILHFDTCFVVAG